MASPNVAIAVSMFSASTRRTDTSMISPCAPPPDHPEDDDGEYSHDDRQLRRSQGDRELVVGDGNGVWNLVGFDGIGLGG